MLLSQSGELPDAVALAALYSAAHPAPSVAPAKRLVKFGDGAEVEYDSEAHALTARIGASVARLKADRLVCDVDGDVAAAWAGGISFSAASVTINADVEVNGAITNNGVDIGSGHKHPGVEIGGGLSGGPS